MTEKQLPKPETPSPNLPDRAMARKYMSRQAVPLADLGCFPMHPHTRNWTTWLRESGELVLVVAAESWLFLWIVDMERAEAHTRIAWPLGEWMADHFEVAFDRDTLWVIVHHNLIEISCQDWEVRSCRCFRDFAAEEAIIEGSIMVPGSPYLWVKTSLPEANFVVEIKSWTVHRHLSLGDSFLTLVPGPDPLVCVTDSDYRSALYRLDGTPLPGGDMTTDYLMYSMARAPHGPGLLTLEVDTNYGMDDDLDMDDDFDMDDDLDMDDEDVSETNNLTLKHLAAADSGSFELIAELDRPVIDEEGGPIFVSRDQGLCFVLVRVLERQRLLKQLLAVEVAGDGTMAVRYQVSVPDDLALVQDLQGRRVVAIFTGEWGLNVLPLGREAPALDHLPRTLFDRSHLATPEFDMTSCGRCLDIDHDRLARQLATRIQQLQPDQLGHFIDLSKAELEGEVELFVCLYYALDVGKWLEDAEAKKERERQQADIHQLLREKHAEQPAVALLFADLEARADRWPEVRRWLRVARPDDFEDSRKGHVMHLEGLALAREGRFDEAFEVFSKARSYEDNSTEEKYEAALSHCNLGDLELLTQPMSDPPTAGEWDQDQPLLRQLLGAMRTADGCRAAGDTEAALAALDRPIFWQTGELQWAARQAELFLEKGEGDGTDLFQKRFAVANFREIYNHRLNRKETYLPGLTWDRERIERIDEQARIWLETTHGGQTGSAP